MRARPFTGFPEAFRALPAHADAAYNVPEYDLAPAELRAVLLIAATPRVGSNLLGDGLRQTCRAGVPLEYLSFKLMPGGRDRSRRWHLPTPRLRDRARQATRLVLRDPAWATVDHSADRVADYLRTVASFRTTPNGVFSLKAHWAHWEPHMVGSGLDADVWGVPVTWVSLDREDRLGQAISFVRAKQSGAWRARVDHEVGATFTPAYDAVAIRRALEAMELGRQGWERYFADQGIAPLRIDYDEVVDDRDGVCRRILDAVDPTADHSWVPTGRTGVRRQADGISDEWRARFVADGGGGALPGS